MRGGLPGLFVQDALVRYVNLPYFEIGSRNIRRKWRLAADFALQPLKVAPTALLSRHAAVLGCVVLKLSNAQSPAIFGGKAKI